MANITRYLPLLAGGARSQIFVAGRALPILPLDVETFIALCCGRSSFVRGPDTAGQRQPKDG